MLYCYDVSANLHQYQRCFSYESLLLSFDLEESVRYQNSHYRLPPCRPYNQMPISTAGQDLLTSSAPFYTFRPVP